MIGFELERFVSDTFMSIAYIYIYIYADTHAREFCDSTQNTIGQQESAYFSINLNYKTSR